MRCPKCGQTIPDESSFCLHCGGLIDPLSLLEEASSGSFCERCGCPLPQTSISTLCVDCLCGSTTDAPREPQTFDPNDLPPPAFDPPVPKERQSFVVHIPEEETSAASEPAQKRLPKWLILLPILLAVALAGFFLVPRFLPGMNLGAIGIGATLDVQEKLAANGAHEMIKAAAYNPDSVHFRQQSLRVRESGGVYTVTQTFERQAPDGQTVEAEFTAVLRLDESVAGGYRAVMLQVGEEVFYDYR